MARKATSKSSGSKSKAGTKSGGTSGQVVERRSSDGGRRESDAGMGDAFSTLR